MLMRCRVAGHICRIFSAAMVLSQGLFIAALSAGEPVEPVSFQHARVTDVWKDYGKLLSFGRGQTLALLDDGCTLSNPEWSTPVDGRPKVLVSYDSVDGDDNPKHEGRGYHGTTIGVPSSLNFQGKWGVAYNNQVAVIRGLECCHCKVGDSATLAAGLQWIVEHHKQYHITVVNLAPVDDLAHDTPVPTEIDAPLLELRKLGVWVSAPTGNHGFTTGISWPASQPNCFAIGAVSPERDVVTQDRHEKVDLLVPASATSSSNAILCGTVMLMREAMELSAYDWKKDGANQPEAMMAIFQKTGIRVEDDATMRKYARLDAKAAIEFVLGNGSKKP